MPWIEHPARQGDNASIADWLRFHIGMWMQRKGADLEHRASTRTTRNVQSAASGSIRGKNATTYRSDGSEHRRGEC